MKDASPAPVHLRDYAPFGYEIDEVHLTFRLAAHATRVHSRIRFRPNLATDDRRFFLHGEGLGLISARIDGQPVSVREAPGGIEADAPDAPFVWEAEVEIDPQGNTALEGLYMSNGMYCTQCEAEGFRKITFYPDRPDVMAVFTVRIEGELPVLLSNGNPGASGEGWAEWHDPWPKPAYLFALVAGDLVAHPGQFTTASGRVVDLNIWVRPGDEGKCAFGMEALRRSMRWDEEVYGREYDLDLFNIVAVDDFNMGAMENKGLNIFNSSCVLASPETSTDANFERIEAIIAHEYFHNWTGNRITCRDWFQLCLKEGLTVYRDQHFTADVRSAAVKRIEDASLMRSRQFREDAGPLAHPVRPESFVEINNFYTITVYEKGAELIGMLRRLVGEEAWARGLELYFDRHDGQACTIEDWLAAFEETSGRDLEQFKLWYSQAGTPRITVEDRFEDGTYTLTLSQETPPTPGQPDKAPLVIPVAVGLLHPDGHEVVPTTVLELTEAQQSFAFEGLEACPIPSILRGFSAPVRIERDSSVEERAFLLAHDTDGFNKWDAGRSLARDVMADMVVSGAGADPVFLGALGRVVTEDEADPAFRALMLSLPGEDEMAELLAGRGHVPDPMAIHHAREALSLEVAQSLQDSLPGLYAAMQVEGPYRPEAGAAGRRALGNRVLAYLSRLDGGAQAARQFAAADNMTQESAALSALLMIGKGEAELAVFHDRWRDDRLVMDKWFAMQVSHAAPERAADVAQELTAHAAFDWRNPNRFRSVFGALAGNAAGFHRADGAAYDLLAEWLIRLDGINPQTAARSTTAFETWRRYDADRQAKIRAALTRIRDADGTSRDISEMVGRLLGD